MAPSANARRPRRRLIVAGALVLLLVVAGAFVARAAIDARHAVGATIANATVAITLTRVDHATATAQPRQLTAHVTLANRSTSPLNYDDVQFTLNGDDGSQAHPQSGTCFTKGDPASACPLAPGASVTSAIVFTIPAGMGGLTLRYQPDGMSNTADLWWRLDA
jgi:hypothetical protein